MLEFLGGVTLHYICNPFHILIKFAQELLK